MAGSWQKATRIGRPSPGRGRRAAMEPLEPRLLLDATPIITEFLADNSVPLYPADPDSDWDWIEIYNPTPSAVDLDGWHLTDDPQDLDQWTFPACTLGAGDYLVVFASGNDQRDPQGDLHTNFRLSKNGDYLALVKPGAAEADVVSEFDFADQLEDVSYGVLYDVQTQTDLVRKGDDATYLVPTDDSPGLAWIQNGYDDSGWQAATTGLGFGLGVPDDEVTLVPKQSVWRYLDDGSDQGAGWRFSGFDDTAWAAGPAQLGYGDGDEATVVSYGGDAQNKHTTTYFRHTFTVEHAWQISDATVNLMRDDGAVVYLNGQELFRDNIADGPVDYKTGTVGTVGGADESRFFTHTDFVNDPADLLVEGDNVLAVEIHQRAGNSSDISFDLEMVATTSTAGLFETDIEADMLGVGPSAYVRIPFTVIDPLEFSHLFLRTAYEDGYVAYLNGVRVASGNAPPAPAWNSTAPEDRPIEQAVVFEGVDLTGRMDLLQSGENVLTIHAMNDAADDGVFLVTPELIAQSDIRIQEQYFITPTPGAENIPGVLGMVGDTRFSVDRGFYDAPFVVEITTGTPGAEIRYTLDGSEPSPTRGEVYQNPIPISTTTTLRAMAFRPGYLATNVDTQTYIFLDQVIRQPSDPAGFPASWNATAANYEMDPDVINDARYADTIKDDLRAVPTVSIVADVEDLFGPGGIYANPGGHGVNWERPTSVEWINPDGSTAFQVNAGLRIVGGASRGAGNKKHSFRLLFKGKYGPTKLRYPVFGDDATDAFDTITLRAGFNDVWPNNRNATYLQDRWAAEQQNAIGGYGPHGAFVHLYVNGLYWGLYNPVERPDDAFAASYLGGDKEDYDIYSIEGRKEGETAAWNQLMGLINDPVANYDAIGRMLDLVNVIDYLIVNQFGANWDWPQNNWWASYNRESGDGKWRFHSWDAEGCLRDLNGNRVDQFGSNLGRIYQNLRQVPEFRQLYADRIHRLLFNGGRLTAEANQALLDEMASFIDRAIVGESARWGDGYNDGAGARNRDDDWVPRIGWLRDTYFPQRGDIVLQQFKNAGLYPDIAAPTFSVNGAYQHGGEVTRGDLLTMGPLGQTIYYTLDGTDPRAPGGSVAPTAVLYAGAITLDDSYGVKARVWSGGEWSALNEADYYLDVVPSLRVSEIMYNPARPTPAEDAAGFEENDDFEFIEVTNIGNEPIPLRDVRFSDGIRFTFPDMTLDPGRFAVAVKNRAAFETRYGAGAAQVAGAFEGSLANGGETVRLDAPTGTNIHDFAYDDDWFPQTDGDGFSLTILDPEGDLGLWNQEAGWRASAAPGGTPGADAEGLVPGAVVINEVLAHTDGPAGDWIELRNTTASDIDITGWFLSDDAGQLDKWRITAPTMIPAGGFKVLTQAADFGGAFALSELGDDLHLTSNVAGVPGGYREHVDFGASPHETSFGLYAKTTGGTDFALLEATTYGGANAPPLVGPLVVNEIMYHPPDPGQGSPYDADDFEFIELTNRSLAPVDPRQYVLASGIGFTFGWYDADSFGNEVWTLQAGATATWRALLAAGDYQVLARWNLADGEGNARDLDTAAAYEVRHAGGPTTVTVNQNVNPTGWVSLGTFTFDAGLAEVVLSRGADDPDRWTIADQVKFVGGGEVVVVDDDTPGAFETTGSDLDTILPGRYVVIVRDEQAFADRYETAGMTVAGRYSGNLANGGEKVTLLAATDAEPTGYIPYYASDRVHYKDGASWPAEPDGRGFSLSRLDPGAYGNDAGNWASGASGGSPGAENDYLDTTPPTTPANVGGQIGVAPDVHIDLAWDASSDPQTWVDYYIIYRDGLPVGAVGQRAYTDTDVLPATPYAYRVSAVNRDGYESAPCDEVVLTVPGIASVTTPEDVLVEVVFSEAVDPVSAQQAAHYVFDNATVQAAALDADGVTVTLVTSQLLAEQTYTLTVNNVRTLAGEAMPPDLQVSFVYSPHGAGYILREYWLGIGGNAVSNLTANPNFPDNPSGISQQTTFEAPTNWANEYGTRMYGYVHPPVSGDYVFYIASDDNSQLFLSTDASPANKDLVAYVPGWTSSRDWTRFAEQRSAAIHLEAGRRYYIEALQKEGGGGDNLAVGWQTPEDAAFNGRPIDGLHLSPFVAETNVTVSIQAGDPDAAEQGSDPGVFIVRRAGDTDTALTVHYTVGGTAAAGDYVETLAGQVVLPAGAASAAIPVTPVDDLDDEDDETVVLTLTFRPDYAIGAAEATVTIADNDEPAPPTVVSINATDPYAAEQGADTGEFTVSRIGSTSGVLTVTYTVGGTADDGDYAESLPGRIDIPAGQTSAGFIVTPTDDARLEGDERLSLTLVPDPSYTLGVSGATVTIADNDGEAPATVHLFATVPGAAEGGGVPGRFVFFRMGGPPGDLTVYYDVAGTASPDDYGPELPGHVVIPAGQAVALLEVTAEDDFIDEPDETIVLTLRTDPAYFVGTPSATVTIADGSETPPLVTVRVEASDAAAAEADADPGEFTITRSGPTAEALTVFCGVGGSAGAGGDYTPVLPDQVQIPAGRESVTLRITPVDDNDDEPDETVVLTLTPDPAYLLGPAEATVTIADNELPAVEGVVLNPGPGRPVRGVSEIDPSGLGVETVRITFDEIVLFAAGDVVAERVAFDAFGGESSAETVAPAGVDGAGTNTMTVTFADAWQTMADTWVRITLADTITDVHGHRLDGEPAADSSGRGYLYDAEADLPSGDGAAGGDAVFYVGNLRADMRGFGPAGDRPNGVVDAWDVTGFTQKYVAGDLDADFRGFGPMGQAPDGAVDSWDISGFTSFYAPAVAGGTRLGDLPASSSQSMAVGAPAPLALLAARPASQQVRPAHAEAAGPATESGRYHVFTPAPVRRDDSETDLAVAGLRPARGRTEAPAILHTVASRGERAAGRHVGAWDAAARRQEAPAFADLPAEAPGFADLLALPALDVAMGP